MARSNTASTLVEWGAILIGAMWLLPRLLAGTAANRARIAGSTIPSSAASQQAARAINTAGYVGNNALANWLSSLLRPTQQQQQQQRPSSSTGMGSFPSSGGAPGRTPVPQPIPIDYSNVDKARAAGYIGPYSPEWYANQAVEASREAGYVGPYSPDWYDAQRYGAMPDLSGLSMYAPDLSGIYGGSIYGYYDVPAPAPDFSEVPISNYYDPYSFYGGSLWDIAAPAPDFSQISIADNYDLWGGGGYEPTWDPYNQEPPMMADDGSTYYPSDYVDDGGDYYYSM